MHGISHVKILITLSNNYQILRKSTKRFFGCYRHNFVTLRCQDAKKKQRVTKAEERWKEKVR